MKLDPNITLQKLEVFCLVAEMRSVTRAADRLGIAQPAVTAHLRSLEEKLALPLVRRNGRNIELTDEGEQVFNWARGLVARCNDFARELSGWRDGSSGTVTIAASMAFGSYRLADIVIEFQATRPNARIISHISNPRFGAEAVRAGACDFAVLILDPHQSTEELVTDVLWHEPLILVARRDSKHLPHVFDLSWVRQVPFVTPPKGLVTRDIEDELLRQRRVTQRNVVLEFGHPEPIKRAIRADAGVGFLLASTVEDELESGQLVKIVVPGLDGFSIPISLVYRSDKNLSPLQLALIADIKRNLSQGPYAKPSEKDQPPLRASKRIPKN
jgi:DNA-binding transcriptional LysR family regulator